jgi:hypothetical protein
MVNSAISGAGIGAADALARGQDVKEGAELGGAFGAAGPLIGRAVGGAFSGARNAVAPVSKVPANTIEVAGVKVPVDRGQLTGDVMTQRFLNSAEMGDHGTGPMQAVKGFRAGQAAALDDAKNAIRGTLGGAEITPLAAAEIAQQGVQRAGTAAKAAATAKYQEFGLKDGKFDAKAFSGLTKDIEGALQAGDLSKGVVPVYLNEPGRSALVNAEKTLSRLSEQYKGSIPVQGIDLVSKQLKAAARSAANPADKFHIEQVIGQFENRIQSAFNSALYSGDATALGTLQEARRLYSVYAQTFKSKGAGDRSGQIIESIICIS